MIDTNKPILDNIITEALTAYGNVYYIIAALEAIGLKVESDEDESSQDVDLPYLLKDTASGMKSIVYLILIKNGLLNAKYGNPGELIDKVDGIIEDYCDYHTKSDFDSNELLQDIEDNILRDIEDKLNEE